MIGIACIYAAADYRLAARAGIEISIGSRVNLISHQGLSPAESAERFEWEGALLKAAGLALRLAR